MAKVRKLEQINKKQDFDADQVLEILRQINAEYTALVSQSEKVVDKVRGPFAELKKTGVCESPSSSISAQLEAKRALLSDIDRKLENLQLSKEKFRLKKECLFYDKKTAECQIKIDNLERELEKAKNEIKERKSILLHEEEEVDAKILQAQIILEELQEKLEAMAFEEELYPDVLVEKIKEMTRLKQEVEQINASIAKYKNLPPSILEARKMLKQAKLEEAKLNERIRKVNEGEFYNQI
ncbi:uncharacterized protein [Anabrus simplex]